jgi:hypothetical protein
VNQHATIEEAVFFVGATPKLYNEDLTQLELELSQELSSIKISEKRWQLRDDGGVQFESVERELTVQLWTVIQWATKADDSLPGNVQ